VESPLRSVEGYRIIWVWSSQLAEQEGNARSRAIRKAVAALEALQATLKGPRCRIHQFIGVKRAAARILEECRAARWIGYSVEVFSEVTFTKIAPGRPSARTRYRRNERKRFHVSWQIRHDLVAADARTDGMFPLITNREADVFPAAEALRAYKQQPRLEKRHSQQQKLLLRMLGVSDRRYSRE
jgi:hypothetical protein